MNASLTIVKESLILEGRSLEIRHNGKIKTMEQYDWVLTTSLRYLREEGFLDEHPFVENITIFDYSGSLIKREKCS